MGKKMQHHLIESGTQVAKVGGGGIGVAGGTYVVSEQTMQAVSDSLTMSEVQAYATLIAAVCTGLYFLAAFILTCIKIWKESKGQNTTGA